jgi:hypothetical protein
MSNPTQDNASEPRNVSYPTAANFYGNHNRNKVPKNEPARTSVENPAQIGCVKIE